MLGVKLVRASFLVAHRLGANPDQRFSRSHAWARARKYTLMPGGSANADLRRAPGRLHSYETLPHGGPFATARAIRRVLTFPRRRGSQRLVNVQRFWRAVGVVTAHREAVRLREKAAPRARPRAPHGADLAAPQRIEAESAGIEESTGTHREFGAGCARRRQTARLGAQISAPATMLGSQEWKSPPCASGPLR